MNTLRNFWKFATAGEVFFGSGVHQRVGQIARRLEAEKALIVTDKNLVRAGLLDMVRKPLLEEGLAIHISDGGVPEPPIRVAEECCQATRELEFEVVIGLGGGSNMDLAKVTALVRTYGGEPADYLGEGKVPGPLMPLIAIPTTAGTSSDVSPVAILTDEEANLKVAVFSPYLRPRVSLVDPLLTLSCPPKTTADSGIDALTHAIEAYTVIDHRYVPVPPEQDVPYSGKSPLGDVLALEAIRLIGRWLRVAVHQGGNLEAREGMSLASLLAGLAFTNTGVAAVHAIEYPLGALTHCTHGEGNGLLLPYVMAYNLPVRVKEFAAIAEALGEEIEGLPLREAAELAVEAVKELKRDIGIPERLRDIGVKREDLDEIAQKSVGIARLMRYQPRPMSLERAKEILESAF